MFKPISLYLGIKYIFSRSRDGFISFVSTSAILGLVLGVAILITVCSVMNGFDKAIHAKLADRMRYIEISSFNKNDFNWQDMRKTILAVEGVASVHPYVSLPGAISYNGQVVPVNIYGINADSLSHFGVSANQISDFEITKFKVILTKKLKEQMFLVKNNKITLIVPSSDQGLFGAMPVLKKFIVSEFTANIMSSAGGYVSLSDAEALLGKSLSFDKLSVAVKNASMAYSVANAIRVKLNYAVMVVDWTNRFDALFKALAMQKTMMILVLSLLIIMACFNLLSSLVMMVNDRQSEIAILRTMGLSRASVMLLFVAQGCVAGVVGIILGVGLGCLLSVNVGSITQLIEKVLGKKLVSADVYWVDVLPSEILFSDVVFVAGVAGALCLLTTLYPAFKAARLSPSVVLRARG